MLLEADEPTMAASSEEDVRLRLLKATDIRQLAWEPCYKLEAEWAARLIFDLDFCVGAYVDGQLAAYAWYALSSIEAQHNRGRSPSSGTSLAFPSHMAFMYRAFTAPDFRGRNLHASLHRFAFKTLRPHGVKAILTTCDWADPSGLGNCYDIGFRYLGKIWRFGIGPGTTGMYPRAAKQLGIRIGRGVAPVASPAAA